MPLRLLLAAVLVLAAGCSRQRANVAVDAALLTQVPSDTIALGAMRVKALRSTAAWKNVLAQPGVNAALDRFAAETSFDPRQNLWEVLWSTDGKDTIVYARGEFAPLGLEPRIDREGVQRMNYKGSMLLGNEENAVWFVNSSTGIFARTPRLRALIDSRDTAKAGPSPALRAKIDAFPPDAHFWMVADTAALPKLPSFDPSKADGMAANFLQNLPKLLQTVQMTSAYASLTDGMLVHLTAFCADEAGAKQVHDSLRGIVGIARIALPEKQRALFLPVLDAAEVAQKQTETTLRTRLTTEQFGRLQSTLMPARAAAPAPTASSPE